jgi:hypothetical protein
MGLAHKGNNKRKKREAVNINRGAAGQSSSTQRVDSAGAIQTHGTTQTVYANELRSVRGNSYTTNYYNNHHYEIQQGTFGGLIRVQR